MKNVHDDPPQNKFRWCDFTSFSKQISASLHLFPFPGMSLMIKICQTVSNISKYLWLVNFTSFIIRIFGGTLLFGPTVRKPVVSRLVLSGSRIRRVEQFHCIALFCSTRRHFYYVWRLRLLGCPRLILLHVQQFGKFKKLFVKSQWVKLLTFIIWLYEPHYFLSILTQCNKWEEFCFKEKKCLDHCTLTCSPNGRTKLQVQIWKKSFLVNYWTINYMYVGQKSGYAPFAPASDMPAAVLLGSKGFVILQNLGLEIRKTRWWLAQCIDSKFIFETQKLHIHIPPPLSPPKTFFASSYQYSTNVQRWHS